jgi:hypothetical protein
MQSSNYGSIRRRIPTAPKMRSWTSANSEPCSGHRSQC